MERPTKVPLPPDGRMGDAVDVPISDTSEKWTEVTLEDGTVLRVKPSLLQAARVPGHYDPEGNPMYVCKITNTMIIAHAPEALRKGSPPGQRRTQ